MAGYLFSLVMWSKGEKRVTLAASSLSQPEETTETLFAPNKISVKICSSYGMRE